MAAQPPVLLERVVEAATPDKPAPAPALDLLAQHVALLAPGGGMAPFSARHPLVSDLLASLGCRRVYAVDLGLRVRPTAAARTQKCLDELRALPRDADGKLRLVLIGFSTGGW